VRGESLDPTEEVVAPIDHLGLVEGNVERKTPASGGGN
jgi:hypothetical protein